MRLGLEPSTAPWLWRDIPALFGSPAALEMGETQVAKDEMWDTVYTTQPHIWIPSPAQTESLRPCWVSEIGKEDQGGGYSSFSQLKIYVPFGKGKKTLAVAPF